MRFIIFETPEEKAQGLQHMPWIDDQTVYLFPDTYGGTVFHSQNVQEPFDIAFVGEDGTVLDLVRMQPPRALVQAPEGSVMAVETKAGRCAMWGILPGETFAPL
jgi:uncharacterized membrane protein (UPF0127 family)